MILQNKSLGEIVKADFRTSRVFQKYGIDFCCGGDRLFLEACATVGVETDVIEKEIREVMSLPEEIDFSKMSAVALIRFILKEHHEYVRQESPLLIELANKVNRVHGNKHPELGEIASVVALIAADMEQHQMKEERILFPYIESLDKVLTNGGTLPPSCFGDVRNPISAMLHDHDEVGTLLFRLKELTHDYQVPVDACQSYANLYRRLEAFQNNTFRHVHLENNILFKEAVQMQDKI